MKLAMSAKTRIAAGALAVAAAWLGQGSGAAEAGGGGCHGSPETEGTGTEVTIAGCFSPTVLRVEPNTKVTFRNRDQYPHVVIGQTWAVSGQMAGSAEAEVEFTAPGSYPYACTLHPGMVGVIVVGDGVGRQAGQFRTIASVRAAEPTVAPSAPAAAVAPAAGGGRSGLAWLGAGATLGVVAAGSAGWALGRRVR